MQSRPLPARPHLDHLKNEAKALLRSLRDGDTDALRRAREVLGDSPATKLTDAQRIIAREYGFPTWARLRDHVEAARLAGGDVLRFLAAVQSMDLEGARRVLATEPSIAHESLHVAAAVGNAEDVRRLVAKDPSQLRQRLGDGLADPLFYLCLSPFHGENDEQDRGLRESARLLLDAGADPNTKDGRYGVTALFGVTGHNHVIPIARMLLDAGANPTDGESMFHAAERYHLEAMELLLSAGSDVNATGEWGNSPLYFLLRFHDLEKEATPGQGVRWLLDHGADPNVRCGKEGETSLHVAVRRGQSLRIIRQLLAHGADVTARRADGASAWQLAMRGGRDEIASVLAENGARPEPLTPADELLAACGRGDVRRARELSSPALVASLAHADRQMLNEAARAGRAAIVNACIAAGFGVNQLSEHGGTALHDASIIGHGEIVSALIAAGANVEARDPEHNATPLGWAVFGADYMNDPAGDYEATVRALVQAGGTEPDTEHGPRHSGARAALGLPPL